MWIDLLIKENGVGLESGSCSVKSLKFIDFFSILGGVPVLSLPIENFSFSIFFARAIEGLSPTLPAAKDFFPNLILPLKNGSLIRLSPGEHRKSRKLSHVDLGAVDEDDEPADEEQDAVRGAREVPRCGGEHGACARLGTHSSVPAR